LKGSTFNSYVKSARAVWQWAVKTGRVQSNPFQAITLKAEQRRERTTSQAEFLAVIRHLSMDWQRVMWFLRLSGTRPQDCGNGTWQGLADGVLTLDKSKTGRRELALGARCRRLLDWLSRHKQDEHFIFPGVTTRAIAHQWRTARRKAGLEAPQGQEQLVPYSLRHTRLTELGGMRLSLPQLLKATGHKTASMALRYMHQETRDVARLLD